MKQKSIKIILAALVSLLATHPVIAQTERQFSLRMCSDLNKDTEIIRNPLRAFTNIFKSLFCVRTNNSDFNLNKVNLLSDSAAQSKADSYIKTYFEKLNQSSDSDSSTSTSTSVGNVEI